MTMVNSFNYLCNKINYQHNQDIGNKLNKLQYMCDTNQGYKGTKLEIQNNKN